MKLKLTEQQTIRREKLEKLKSIGRDPYFSKFNVSINIDELNKLYNDKTKEELSSNQTPEYSIAGRVMMVRDQGKAMFIAIKSNGQSFQFYLRKDSVSEKD